MEFYIFQRRQNIPLELHWDFFTIGIPLGFQRHGEKNTVESQWIFFYPLESHWDFFPHRNSTEFHWDTTGIPNIFSVGYGPLVLIPGERYRPLGSSCLVTVWYQKHFIMYKSCLSLTCITGEQIRPLEASYYLYMYFYFQLDCFFFGIFHISNLYS